MIYPPAFSAALLAQTHKIERMCQERYARKASKIKLISSFLSMEGEEISEYQIGKILEKKRVALSFDEITEVKNINRVCGALPKWDPLSIRDFKACHAILMAGLEEGSGRWRKEEVAVFEGKKIAHVPPQAQKVRGLMRELFHYIKAHKEISWIIRACLFHYGIQYIHPFSDGNGRMGRIWQHRLLLEEGPLFEQLLIGQIIKTHARAYYQSLDKSDKTQDCAFFIAFCVKKIAAQLNKMAC